MSLRKIYWFGIIIIVIVSLGITLYAPIGEAYKGIAVLPSIGALFTALFQFIRDSYVHQKKLEIQNKQQLFNLGTTSHMANTVFDKHVEFCEKYLAEVHELVITLTREGPTQSALEHLSNLYDLRIKYTAWVTPEIEEKLMPFEQAVRKIGSNSSLVKALSGEENSDGSRTKALNEMYDTFKSLMSIGEVNVKDEDATIAEVKNKVREILQVNELVAIRKYLITKAVSITDKLNLTNNNNQ